MNLLGEFEARDAAGRQVSIAAKKNRALLAALVFAPGCAMRRHRIARLLWSDRDEEQGRRSLRQALVALRKDLAGFGTTVFTFEDDQVKLDPSAVEVDAHAFARLAEADDITRLRQAAALYRGELLAGAGVRDREFESWVTGERQRLTDLAIGVFEKLFALEPGAARVDVARRLVALDPAREESHLKLMLALAEIGERSAALRQYDICRDTLSAELDAIPGTEIEALRGQLLKSTGKFERSRGAPDAAASSPASQTSIADDMPSIAVLPFDPMGDAALKSFSDGLTEDIITGLARIKAIRVVARNTVMTYGGRPVDIREVAKALNVRYVLEGSVRKTVSRTRVTGQLIEAASGLHVWAGQIDSTLSDTLTAQDEITCGIVSSVQTQIILHEGRALAAGNTAHDRVKHLLARSWQQLLRLTAESLAESRLLAERAVQIESDNGTAHRMMAVALYHQMVMGFIPWTDATVEEIHAHAKIAVEAEDADEFSHWAMLCAQLLKGEHERALQSVQRALAINPNCSLVHGSMGTLLAWAGQSERSIAQNEFAIRINADDPSIFFRYFGLALAHYLAGRYDKALEHAHAVLQCSPNWWLGLLLGTACLGQMGRAQEAARMYKDLVSIRPNLSAADLEILPFAKESDRAHLIEGLRKAGLPD